VAVIAQRLTRPEQAKAAVLVIRHPWRPVGRGSAALDWLTAGHDRWSTAQLQQWQWQWHGPHGIMHLQASARDVPRKAIRTHDLYIHPLYVLVSNILSSIFNSPVLIHHLYHPLSTMGPTCHFI
jgi:hypothetical protein